MMRFTEILTGNPSDSTLLRAQASLGYLVQLFLIPALGWHFTMQAAGAPPDGVLAPALWNVMLLIPLAFLLRSWSRFYVRKHAFAALALAFVSTVLGQGWIFTVENAPLWLALLWVGALFGLWLANTE